MADPAPTVVLTVASPDDAEAALSCPALVPPPAPPTLRPGPTAALRAAMARFSAGDAHRDRRAAVEAVVSSLDPAAVGRLAAAATGRRLTGEPVDALADVAFRVPTEALASALGARPADLPGLVADTGRMVAVIGRGEPSRPASDAAVSRILARFADHPAGPVPVASLLHQNHDATAALIAATLVARHRGVPRRAAVAATVRVATAPATLGMTTLAAGDRVVVDLESSGLEFGAGPHRCPGRAVAEAIAAAVVDTLSAEGYRLMTDRAELEPDGRPRTLPMAVLPAPR
jgi:cytochrome P450